MCRIPPAASLASRFDAVAKIRPAIALLLGIAVVFIFSSCANPPGGSDDNASGGPVLEPDCYVPGDFATIQAAIDNASAGESILVAESVRTLLQNDGFDAEYVLSAEEGLGHLDDDPSIDLVLMDIHLGQGRIDGGGAARVASATTSR